MKSLGKQMILLFAGLTGKPSGRIFTAAAVLLLAGVLLWGCGLKGDPVAPVRNREPVKEKSAAQTSKADTDAGGEMMIQVNSKHESRISNLFRISDFEIRI